MADFSNIEDFPRSEIEFDARFSQPEDCYTYFFKQKWPNGFMCSKYGNQHYWLSSRQLYICTIRSFILDATVISQKLVLLPHYIVVKRSKFIQHIAV